MANPPTASSAPATTANSSTAGNVKSKDGTSMTPEQQYRAQLNTAIMQASLTVAINSGNQPQALLFSSAHDLMVQGFDAFQKAIMDTPAGASASLTLMPRN